MATIRIDSDFNRYNTSLQGGVLTSLFAFANQDFTIIKPTGENDARVIKGQYMDPDADQYVWMVMYGEGDTDGNFLRGPQITMFDNPSPNVLALLAEWLATEPGM
jgi:hypothetical protein